MDNSNWKKTKKIYWSDEINDDFDEICLPRPSVPSKYKYIRNNPINNFFSGILYHGIARPVLGTFLIFKGVKYKNKQALKRTKGKGAFIFSNHVSFTDVVKFQPFANKRVNILGYSDSLAMPVVKHICRALGYLPLPLIDDSNNIKKLEDSFKFYVDKKQHVLIFPEAHIWPYYTKIRNFKSSSFIYPARCKAPVIPAVTVWRKSKLFNRPKQTIIFANPIFPLDEYNELENRDYLYSRCLEEMKKISESYKQFEYIQYIKVEDNKNEKN